MALPTPTNTWTISPNNTIYTNGSTNTDSDGRRRDIADFLGTFVSQLIILGGGDIVCVGSSDGVSTSTTGTNYWVAGSTNFRQSIYNATSPYNVYPATWVILALGSGPGAPQIAITVGQSDGSYYSLRYFSMYYSPSGAFAFPGTVYDRPVASVDEILLGYWDCKSNSGGIFNQDNLGIVNTNNSFTSYTQQIHVGLGRSPAGAVTSFYAVTYHSFFPSFIIWFGGLDNAVATTTGSPRNWTTAKACFQSGSLSQRNLVGPYGDGAGLMIRSTYEPNGLRAVMPSTQNFDGQGNSTNYQGVAYNPVIYNAVPDLETGLLPVLPIGAYSHNYKGIKGLFSDIWWGASNGNANVYPASGPVEFIQVNDVILPWDTAVALPLFTG